MSRSPYGQFDPISPPQVLKVPSPSPASYYNQFGQQTLNTFEALPSCNNLPSHQTWNVPSTSFGVCSINPSGYVVQNETNGNTTFLNMDTMSPIVINSGELPEIQNLSENLSANLSLTEIGTDSLDRLTINTLENVYKM